jgi:lysozyme family protein
MLRTNYAVSSLISRLTGGGNCQRSCLRAAILLLMLCAPLLAHADEPLFGFTYTTDTLPKGKYEVEQWSTTRFTKAQGNFWLQENRTEFSYGLSSRFQLSLYQDYDSTVSYHNGPFGATTPGEPFSYDTPDPNAHYRDSAYIATDVEAIYRILSPYEHFVGLGVYSEERAGRDFFETENSLLFQKNFRQDRVVLAANFTYAPELRNDRPGPLTLNETDMNAYYAASYRFIPNWSAGFELLNEREFDGWTFWNREINDAYFTGPSVHYGGKHFFATGTFVEQMPWATTHAATNAGTIVGGRDYDNDFEKYRVRLKVGWYF